MVTVPLGRGAYKRSYAGEPEIVLQNRYAEKDPSNLREHQTLIARAGSNSLTTGCTGGVIRGTYSKAGAFNGDLFVVSGHNFWRVPSTAIPQQITGTIAGDGNPYLTWMKGIGYEYIFISDGSTLQYFSEHAVGILTLTGNIQEGMVIDINGVYYGWSATVDHGSPAGTAGNPYWAKLATGGTSTQQNNSDSLANMVLMINGSGINGSDYSTARTAPDANVTATSTDTTLTVTAIDNTVAGNAITTTVSVSGGGSIAWGAATLAGGGGTALQSVTGMGASEVAKALATVSGYVLVSVGNSQKFYWINPGETTIDPLNFAEKESNPDNILDMLTVGDQVIICGDGSAENWYATGDFAAPFLPVEGRVYARGVVEGTPVVVNDGVILVGNDGRVYQVGYKYGGQAQWGVHCISNHGIEERVRTQLRFEQRLAP
jgi:hypothetical protein